MASTPSLQSSQTPRRRRVLSIDGGGIRGVIPAHVLAYIESVSGQSAAQLFDLIVGTSTGGILALGLTLPDASRGKQSPAPVPRYSAAELKVLYAQEGEAIFSRSLLHRLRSLGGTLEETYDDDALEAILGTYFGGATLGEAITPAMVTSYDIEARDTVFLKSWHPTHAGIPLQQAARATAAAPTYFEPAQVEWGGQMRPLIDGGVFLNSPVVSAYAEALKLFPGDEIHVLSLGTGELTRSIRFEQAQAWGAVGWVLPLIDCMFDGMAKAADYQMRLFLGERYHRLQTSLDIASDDLDDTSPENIANLERTADRLIEEQEATLARFIAGCLLG